MIKKGTVRAICISDVRGTQKKDVKTAELETGWGIKGDAHGGDWHRQVSLISYDKVCEFNERGAMVDHGAFGENLVVEGIDFRSLPVGTVLKCNGAALEITQIGKECHTHCQIYHKMGDCIMPREGVFARVLEAGSISAGDIMEVVSPEKTLTAAILTVSDKASAKMRKDESAPAIEKILLSGGYNVADTIIVPDEQDQIEAVLINLCDRRQVDLVITTGGTGFSLRDVTPEATMNVASRNAPGIAEAVRANSMKITGRAMLSRGASVIRGKTLIVNLPGSPKAVSECMEFILPHLGHGIEILKGEAFECARTD